MPQSFMQYTVINSDMIWAIIIMPVFLKKI